jgi:hypothetical protein
MVLLIAIRVYGPSVMSIVRFLWSEYLLLLVTSFCTNILNRRVDPMCSVTHLTSHTHLPLQSPVSSMVCPWNLRQNSTGCSLYIGKDVTRYRCFCIHIGQYPRYVLTLCLLTSHCRELCAGYRMKYGARNRTRFISLSQIHKILNPRQHFFSYKYT